MNKQTHKIHSNILQRDMEYITYGSEGEPVIVFPSQDGTPADYENFDMVSIWQPYIDAGRARLICVDSIDKETWSALNADPKARAEKQENYYHFIVDELVPRERRDNELMMATGCSMGAYHAANFFFRRPDIFDKVLSLSGIYNSEPFFGNYCDENLYFNVPLACLPNLAPDHPYIKLYNQRKLIFCVGQGNWEGPLLESTRRLDAVLRAKGVKAWVDYWGADVSHDWTWWRKQLKYFLETDIFR